MATHVNKVVRLYPWHSVNATLTIDNGANERLRRYPRSENLKPEASLWSGQKDLSRQFRCLELDFDAQQSYVVGLGQACDIQVQRGTQYAEEWEEYDNEHCELFCDGHNVFVKDLGSKLGTEVLINNHPFPLGSLSKCILVRPGVGSPVTNLVVSIGKHCHFEMPQLIKIKVLGEGTFGRATLRATLVMSADTGEQCVVKEPTGNRTDDQQRNKEEASVMMKLEHPNVLKCFGFEDEPPRMFLEYANGGTLVEFSRSGMNTYGCLQLLQQVSSALAYADTKQMAHRDLSLGNIFLFQGKASQTVFKIGDFGAAKNTEDMRTVMGTPRFMAPEIWRNERKERGKKECYGAPVDLWSLGTIVIHLRFRNLMGESRNSEDKEERCRDLANQVKNLDTSSFDKHTRELIQIVSSLVVFDPKLRLSASKCAELANDELKTYESASAASPASKDDSSVTSSAGKPGAELLASGTGQGLSAPVSPRSSSLEGLNRSTGQGLSEPVFFHFSSLEDTDSTARASRLDNPEATARSMAAGNSVMTCEPMASFPSPPQTEESKGHKRKRTPDRLSSPDEPSSPASKKQRTRSDVRALSRSLSYTSLGPDSGDEVGRAAHREGVEDRDSTVTEDKKSKKP